MVAKSNFILKRIDLRMTYKDYKPIHKRDFNSIKDEIEKQAFLMEARNAASVFAERYQYSPPQFWQQVSQYLNEMASERLGGPTPPAEQARNPENGQFVSAGAQDRQTIFDQLSNPQEEARQFMQEWVEAGKAQNPEWRGDLTGTYRPGKETSSRVPHSNALDRNWEVPGAPAKPKRRNIFGEVE